jgi:hypothetical protein
VAKADNRRRQCVRVSYSRGLWAVLFRREVGLCKMKAIGLTYVVSKLPTSFLTATTKKMGGKKQVAPKSSATTVPSSNFLKLRGVMSQGQRYRPVWASATKSTGVALSIYLMIYHGRRGIPERPYPAAWHNAMMMSREGILSLARKPKSGADMVASRGYMWWRDDAMYTIGLLQIGAHIISLPLSDISPPA